MTFLNLARYQKAQNLARASMKGRERLAENINSLDEYRKLARTKEWPDGSQWLAATGEVYGPEKRKAE